MFTSLVNYEIVEKIYESSRTIVYKGLRKFDDLSIIIKTFKNSNPTLTELENFRSQFKIIQSLEMSGVIKAYSLEQSHKGLAIILEDYGGISLQNFIDVNVVGEVKKLSIDLFFLISLQLCEILEYLYRNNIIHKDIKPDNILIHPNTLEIKLIDFSVATQSQEELKKQETSSTIEGTLAYMSPEQTGRINRKIDYRTDFYSLGVTFFRLLTGELPFKSKVPLELIHEHIASTPISPSQINQEIPASLSQVILKLLEKSPENRYQTSYGLASDLTHSQDLWKSGNISTIFQLGENDISDKFKVSEKLYGRKNDIKFLVNEYEKSKNGTSDIILISGQSGVGKTRIVQEIRNPKVLQKGYFVSGKYESFQCDTPFSGLIKALGNLIQQILIESELRVNEWKDKILYEVGDNGQILIDVLPELYNIIGNQPPVSELDPLASQNRFKFIFQRFIYAFPSSDSPLVIFLDDFQWADQESLEFLKNLIVEEKTVNLLIICAYCSEIDDSSSLLRFNINEGKEEGIKLSSIHLNPLTCEDIENLVKDTFKKSSSATDLLSNEIYKFSNGNPFSCIQTLNNLYSEKLIFFDWESKAWEWKLHEIRLLLSNQNTFELIISQFYKLSNLAQEILKVASCSGSNFSSNCLENILELSSVNVDFGLLEASKLGFVILRDSLNFNYKNKDLEQLDIKNNSSIIFSKAGKYQCDFQFVYDNYRHVIYSLISSKEKSLIHNKIGNYLINVCSNSSEKELIIFEITKHFNLAIDSVQDFSDKVNIANLNFISGCKAKSSAAFRDAFKFFTSGIDVLSLTDWNSHYELNFNLYLGAAESAMLIASYEQMFEFIQVLDKNVVNKLDKIKVFRILIEAYKAQGQIKDAIEVGLSALNLLEINISKALDFENLYIQYQETQSYLESQNFENITNSFLMTDDRKLVAINLLGDLLPITYSYDSNLFSILIFKLINFSLKYGNSPNSSWAYIAYGIITWSVTGNIENTYDFGLIGKKLGEQFGLLDHITKVNFAFNYFISHWKSHLRDTLSPLLNNYLLCIENGDLLHACFSFSAFIEHSFICGIPLSEIEKKIIESKNSIQKLNQEIPVKIFEIYSQSILKLVGNKSLLSSDDVENSQLLIDIDNRQAIFILHLSRLQYYYTLRNFYESVKEINLAEVYLDSVPGRVVVVNFLFYKLLTNFAIYPTVSPAEKSKILEISLIQINQLKVWADHAPMNYLHKYFLVLAEYHRTLGQYIEAIEAFEQAIALARESKYLSDEALASELTGEFYLNWGKITIAQTYITNAYYAYERWGANEKLCHLDQCYPNLFNRFQSSKRLINSNVLATLSVENSLNNNADILDWTSILRSTQALSQEIDQEKLLCIIMEIILENAGADQGSLFLIEDYQLFLKVHCTLESSNTKISKLFNLPKQSVVSLPISIVNYVERTQQALVLADATTDAMFAGDSYISERQVRSILCMPVQRQGKQIGILYLENNKVSNVFTKDRLEILQILVSQAAISLENAQLYASVEQKVKDRTLELETAKLEAERAKDKAVQADRAKSEFLANMSHELRTPLNAVLGFSQILHRDPSASLEQQKKLSIIRRSGEHLLTLINDVLTMSKIESGRTTLNEASFNFQQMLNSLHDMLSLKASEKNLRFQFHAAEDIPQFIYTDEVKLRQVLINLLGNAIKFTQQGSVLLSISLDSSQETSTMSSTAQNSITLNFKVEDTGPGIAPDEMNALFQAFSQTKVGRQSQEGTGLGLSISRTFVQLMGGDIWVTSQPGQGSSFCFNIQVGLPEPLAIVDSTELGNIIGLEPNQPQYRILVVDDKLENQQVLSEMLDMVGFEVGVASNGQEAIEIWQTYPFDLIFMDLLMPLMDGHEASRQILKTAKNQEKLPIIIAITADTSKVTQQNLQENLFQDIQTKPIQIENLLKVIAKHLGVRYLYEGTVQAQTVEQSNELYASYTHASSIDFERLPQSWIKEVISAASTLDESTLMVLVAQIKQEHPAVSEAILKLMDSFDFETIIQQLQPFLV